MSAVSQLVLHIVHIEALGFIETGYYIFIILWLQVVTMQTVLLHVPRKRHCSSLLRGRRKYPYNCMLRHMFPGKEFSIVWSELSQFSRSCREVSSARNILLVRERTLDNVEETGYEETVHQPKPSSFNEEYFFLTPFYFQHCFCCVAQACIRNNCALVLITPVHINSMKIT